MALSEQSIIDQISVDANNNVHVRRADQILRDDEVISTSYHRHVLQPGDDLSEQDPKVVAIASAVWG